MTTLHNEVIIDASVEKIWDVLSKVDELGKYDPYGKEIKSDFGNQEWDWCSKKGGHEGWQELV